MLSRESLRELVDTLPEGALESAERVLRNYQIWPPRPPIEVEEMRERVHELFRKNIEEQIARTGRGVIGSHVMGSHFKPDGDGSASMSTSEGQTLVTFELLIFRGHRLEIEERLRMSEDNKSLLYTQAITGPDGKVGRYEVAFEATQGIPPVSNG
jgi:hypothetical protein